jgi:hypothetical protein
VRLLDGSITTGHASGHNVAWMCTCRQEAMPLLAAYTVESFTTCPRCSRHYRFDEAADAVIELAAESLEESQPHPR